MYPFTRIELNSPFETNPKIVSLCNSHNGVHTNTSLITGNFHSLLHHFGYTVIEDSSQLSYTHARIGYTLDGESIRFLLTAICTYHKYKNVRCRCSSMSVQTYVHVQSIISHILKFISYGIPLTNVVSFSHRRPSCRGTLTATKSVLSS